MSRRVVNLEIDVTRINEGEERTVSHPPSYANSSVVSSAPSRSSSSKSRCVRFVEEIPTPLVSTNKDLQSNDSAPTDAISPVNARSSDFSAFTPLSHRHDSAAASREIGSLDSGTIPKPLNNKVRVGGREPSMDHQKCGSDLASMMLRYVASSEDIKKQQNISSLSFV